MPHKKNNVPLVMLSGCWPGSSKGYELAVDSDLKSVSKIFDNIYYLGPEDETFDSNLETKFPNVKFVKMPFTRDSKLWRFARTMFSSVPATSYRYSRAEKTVMLFLNSVFSSNTKFYVYFQDIPISILKNVISLDFNNSLHIVRSHNVVYTGFNSLLSSYSLFKRMAWSLELSKIKKHELTSLINSDVSIAISNDDAREYKRLGVEVDYVLPVYIDPSKYKDCPDGDFNKLVNIGTADLRKGSALVSFINETWTKIRERATTFDSFTIAGKGTTQFNSKRDNIFGLGPVNNDIELLSQGKFFVNPQKDGSGIKIKSIIALMSKKVLLSTDIGVEGMDLIDGVHYLNISDASQSIERLEFLFSNTQKISEMANNGQAFAIRSFGNSDNVDKIVNSIFENRQKTKES